jgi:hypothetical protein
MENCLFLLEDVLTGVLFFQKEVNDKLMLEGKLGTNEATIITIFIKDS